MLPEEELVWCWPVCGPMRQAARRNSCAVLIRRHRKSQWAWGVRMAVIRVPTAKDVLHKASRSDVSQVDRLVGQRHRDAVHLLGLPSLLDAVINKSHEASCHDNAVVSC